MNRTYRTPKGLELPLLNLRGKEYLEVKYRLVWFREVHPDWGIVTTFLTDEIDHAFVRAEIRNPDGMIMATAHKFEDKKGFPDFREKSETSAIGRALAMIGFGTQFTADELDEGNRIVDSPGAPSSKPQSSVSQDDLGEYEIMHGKYKNMKLKNVPPDQLNDYLTWLETQARQARKELTGPMKELKEKANKFYGSQP